MSVVATAVSNASSGGSFQASHVAWSIVQVPPVAIGSKLLDSSIPISHGSSCLSCGVPPATDLISLDGEVLPSCWLSKLSVLVG